MNYRSVCSYITHEPYTIPYITDPGLWKFKFGSETEKCTWILALLQSQFFWLCPSLLDGTHFHPQMFFYIQTPYFTYCIWIRFFFRKFKSGTVKCSRTLDPLRSVSVPISDIQYSPKCSLGAWEATAPHWPEEKRKRKRAFSEPTRFICSNRSLVWLLKQYCKR